MMENPYAAPKSNLAKDASTKLDSGLNISEIQSANGKRKRGKVLSTLLIVFGVSTSFAAVANLMKSSAIAAFIPNAPPWASEGIFALGLIGVAAVAALIAIWKWHRWGAYLYATTIAVTFCINILLVGGLTPFVGVLGGATLLYFVSRQWKEFE